MNMATRMVTVVTGGYGSSGVGQLSLKLTLKIERLQWRRMEIGSARVGPWG